MTEHNASLHPPGGSFLIEDVDYRGMTIPEDLSDEQRMIGDVTESFLMQEVIPYDTELEKLDYKLTVELLRKAGELGLLGADVPEGFGGLGLDKVSSTLISEKLAKALPSPYRWAPMSESVRCRSFTSELTSRKSGICPSSQAGNGSLPIVSPSLHPALTH